MRKLLINTFLSLDGVMQAPGAPEEDKDAGFAYGGWAVNYWDDRMNELMSAVMTEPFDLLLGRRTYDIFAAHWPHTSEELGSGPLNNATKYVASRGTPTLGWDKSVLLGADVPAAVADLKAGDGPDLQVHGSADLIQTLLRHDLIDEFGLWIFPVLLGSGKRLFAQGTVPGGLRLTRSESMSTGVTFSTYVPAGEVVPGSFALDRPVT
jgi:dihydrofolate reductase